MANKTITFGADLLPNSTSSSYSLGNSTKKWQINGVADPKLTDTTYSIGTASSSGLTKLYTSTGTATDGTMTQAAIKNALDTKMDMRDDLSPISTDRINEICGYSYENLIAGILEAIENGSY